VPGGTPQCASCFMFHRRVHRVQGNNDEDLADTSRNQYTLVDFASVPPDAGHPREPPSLRTTLEEFQNRFALLHVVSFPPYGAAGMAASGLHGSCSFRTGL